MTETRKQIIELIEPFMDKTLSEGCLIRNIYDIYPVVNKGTCIVIENEGVFGQYGVFIKEISKIKEFRHLYYNNIRIDEILGHYDITAVETFFIEKGFYVIAYKSHYEIRGKGILDGKEYLDVFYGNFPRKPLHVYNEKQDKNLLELLREIGK